MARKHLLDMSTGTLYCGTPNLPELAHTCVIPAVTCPSCLHALIERSEEPVPPFNFVGVEEYLEALERITPKHQVLLVRDLMFLRIQAAQEVLMDKTADKETWKAFIAWAAGQTPKGKLLFIGPLNAYIEGTLK